MRKETKKNSLQDLTANIGGWGMNPFTPQNSRLDTIFVNTRWMLISNFRSILSEAYAEYGLVQTLVDQPVADAFRSGFSIESDRLSDEQKRILQKFVEKNRIIEEIQKAICWARLFGGAGIVVMTDQNPSTPLNLKEIDENNPLEFRAADMWELYKDEANMWNPWEDNADDKLYNYYGVRLHNSRVFPIRGKEAPSFLKPRLRGWGMSELERVVRSINSYLKNQDLIFELLDEAKVDVYQLNGFNTAMLTQQGTRVAEKRLQLANSTKSYLNALILDTNDKYNQKQLSFSGLSDILNQIRQGVASDLKMPMTKLFGVSASGFNSGEDDIENYNSMIESEIRSKVKYIVVDVLEICCQYLFGEIPEDLMINFKPLRVLSAEQEENMKNSTYDRLMSAYANGLVTPEEFMIGCNNDNLLPVTFNKQDIELASKMGTENMSFEGNDDSDNEEKQGLLGKIFRRKPSGDPEKAISAESKESPSQSGKVKLRDVTSNKFIQPDREMKPEQTKAFGYKAKRAHMYVKAQ